MAWVVFSNQRNDEQEENVVPVSKIIRPGLNHWTQEKPMFPSIITDPQSCVALELNDVDGDKVPYTINRYLRNYQREGVRFIYNNYIRSSGCILGDDMGLGKTVQVKSTSAARHFMSFISMTLFCVCLSHCCSLPLRSLLFFQLCCIKQAHGWMSRKTGLSSCKVNLPRGRISQIKQVLKYSTCIKKTHLSQYIELFVQIQQL